MKYAVIELSGSQFLVSEGDHLKVNHLDSEVGASLKLKPLLLVDGTEMELGRPNVEKETVVLKVLEHGRDKKVEVRHFKSKSRYRKHRGHREPISIVEVVQISPKSVAIKTAAEKTMGEKNGLDNLEISTRTKNALEKAGISKMGDLKKMSPEEIASIKGIGDKAVEEILAAIK